MKKPHIKIGGPDGRRRQPRRRESRPKRLLSAEDRKSAGRCVTVNFSMEPPGTYERIFGQTEEQRRAKSGS